jgi:flagellar motor switch protein FliG
MAISNLHKAAVFLLSLPKEQAAALVGRLGPEQAKVVMGEMGQLKKIDAAEGEAVAREFAAAREADVADQEPVEPAEAAPFEFLRDVDGKELSRLIGGEHPQVIALILSYLAPQQAADAIEGLPMDTQLSVVYHIAEMGEPSPEIVRDVEDALRYVLTGGPDQPAVHHGVASVVRLLNVIEPAIERRLLDELAEADPELEREIRRVMFGADVAQRREQLMTKAAC